MVKRSSSFEVRRLKKTAELGKTPSPEALAVLKPLEEESAKRFGITKLVGGTPEDNKFWSCLIGSTRKQPVYMAMGGGIPPYWSEPYVARYVAQRELRTDNVVLDRVFVDVYDYWFVFRGGGERIYINGATNSSEFFRKLDYPPLDEIIGQYKFDYEADWRKYDGLYQEYKRWIPASNH